MPNSSDRAKPAYSLTRRHFMQLAGVSTAVMTLPRMSAYAGPFVKEDFLKLIPPDKKLDPAWVASLTTRGEPETFTGEALERIGMPVGGMFTGTLYLGGDGRLWLWDIFNQRRHGLEAHTATYRGKELNSVRGSNYRHLEQGFSLIVKSSAGETRRTLDNSKTGFRNVSFTGEYPIGVVCYSDPELPVQVKLEAFSPFSPLNVNHSSLPLTVSVLKSKTPAVKKSKSNSKACWKMACFTITATLAGNATAPPATSREPPWWNSPRCSTNSLLKWGKMSCSRIGPSRPSRRWDGPSKERPSARDPSPSATCRPT